MRSLRTYRTAILVLLLTLVTVLLLFITKPFSQQSKNVLSRLLRPHSNVAGDSSQGRLEQRLNELYDGVQTFVLFIGHARSGHSLIGAILDAHPEIIISHEYNAISKWDDYKTKSSDKLKTRLFYDLHSFSQFQAMFGNRPSSLCGDNGYCYNVPGQWQGTYKDRIKVIGDKKGAATSRYFQNPKNLDILNDLTKTLKIPLKFVHVIRNPFDNIAPRVLRSLEVRDMARDNTFKANKSALLDRIIGNYFAEVESAQRLYQQGKYEILDIYGHEAISNPPDNLHTLCNFLGVTCNEDYIEACAKLLYSKPALTKTFRCMDYE